MKSKKPRRFHQRSRIDIIACILENSNEGSRKTRLIYRCNLSHAQFILYRDCLIETGLLKLSTLEDGTEIYETTSKGREFLRDYRNLKNVLDKMRL